MSTNISLTPELELYAKNQVSSGLYNSVSEFMREAVRLHREKNIERQLYLQAMHKELSLAEAEIDQGQLSSFNMQELTERAFNEIDSENAQ
ncbi:MAG: type II toxin-antitoxin system ParD family antitoxin [Piscirickettsiaceae bacterium]|nr:type II toxin-antitoxin system ParD family antitoxin [Piscirickettsiaceae bacterium]